MEDLTFEQQAQVAILSSQFKSMTKDELKGRFKEFLVLFYEQQNCFKKIINGNFSGANNGIN